MTDSILDLTKKNVGLYPDDTSFDLDITMHINTVFFKLHQLGVGPASVFEIEDKADTWAQFFGATKQNAAKTFMYLSVRLMFDPPSTSFGINAMESQVKELEWRLEVASGSPDALASG